jgi:2-oxoglutarate dehydrogenase E1 component
MLSEVAVLGFEYGYSLERPHGLTIWEAQFGDFANGAQVIIDQFIAGSMSKWDRASGLTLLLPHGYEGQGAEHSSARIERYLQLCAEMNLQVVYPSTPAQYFHLLRRQVKQSFRRPLIVFTPKSLLRLPACRSSLDELSSGYFAEILPPDRPAETTRTLMLCSGKLYYELAARREADGRDDVAIGRIEQLYPLRVDQLAAALAPYAGAQLLWVQEEPQNGGAWHYLKPHLQQILGYEPRYVGRYASAAPAVASHRLHMEEQQAILDYAFGRLTAVKQA